MRPSLRELLVGINVVLVALAVVLVALAAAARLEDLADEQALARVALAGSSAVKEISNVGEELQTSTRLLGERPTLARLLEAGDRIALARFLAQFRETGRLDACAVMEESAILASSGGPGTGAGVDGSLPRWEIGAGGPIPWREIASDPAALKGRAYILKPPGGALLLAAGSDVAARPGVKAACARVVDRSLAQEVADQVGLPVSILDREAALAREGDPQADLRAGALMDGRSTTARLDEAGLYLDVRPLMDSGDRPVGIVETSLDRDPILASLRDLERSLTGLAIGVVVAAAATSFLLAGWITLPLAALRRATERIGGGDLSTPIPRASGREVGALAETMEEMRRRLLDLTAELSRRRAEAEAILGGIVEGVFAVDRERRIRYLNPQAASLLGIDPGEVLGRFCGDVLNPRLPGGGRPCEESCPIIHARFGGGAHATESLLLPGGEHKVVVITSAAAGEGDPSGAGAAPETMRQFQVIRDETDVEAARRLRDTVLANISHEFKTPLAAQLASIELLRDRLPELNSPEAQQLVLSLERGTLRLTHLIDNLLESVRIEAGRLSIRKRPVALDEVIEEATEMTAPLIKQRGQVLAADLPYPLPPIQGDGQRLTQVFVNLLANASKFAPAGSEIRVGGAVGAGEVRLWVEDEGPGLPPGAGTSLFERFVRTPGPDDEEEPEQSGMGLGLWIVKSVVERHGGRVEAGPAWGSARDGTTARPAAGQDEGRAEARRHGPASGRPGEVRDAESALVGERVDAAANHDRHGGPARPEAGPGTRISVILPVVKGDEDPDRR